jgi:hypothetical protein
MLNLLVLHISIGLKRLRFPFMETENDGYAIRFRTPVESSSAIHSFITALEPFVHLPSITTVYLDFSPDLRCVLHTSLPVHCGFAHCISLAVSLVRNPLFTFATLIIHMYTVYCVFSCVVTLNRLVEPEQGGHCHPLKDQKLFTH